MNTKVDRQAARTVPQMVTAGLNRCTDARAVVGELRPTTHLGQAIRCERMAALAEREARWWTVLERWTYLSQWEVPTVYGRAAIVAANTARDRARLYSDLATDWRKRAAGQPVCDVIGCGCGGTCGVAA